MKKLRVFILFLGYVGIVWIIFLGVQRGEVMARDAWFTFVTKRMVSEKAHVPIEKCILGIYKPELPYSFNPLRKLEDSLDQEFTLVSFYQAWGEDAQSHFQPALMNNVIQNGCVPIVTWEPWVSEFQQEHLTKMPEREWRSLRDVARGKYDFYIGEWAKAAVAWGKPFFLRFAHEMTNPQYPWTPKNGNTPADYILAWRHVRSVFDSLGAKNVIWVWCPYGTDVLGWYPGDDYVDWVAMDVFNYGELLFDEGQPQRWMTFDQLASPLYRELSTLRKPIMVAEVGCSDIGGSREVWYREMAMQIRNKFTNIKAVVLFENPADVTSGTWNIDWSIAESPYIIDELRREFQNEYFIHMPDYLNSLSSSPTQEEEHNETR